MGNRTNRSRALFAVLNMLLFAAFLGLTFPAGGDPPGDPYVASTTDDLDADGTDDEVIAAPEGESPQSDPGEVYINSGENGELVVTFVGNAEEDLFGWAVHCSTDLTGDGSKDVIIGAPHEDRGHVYVFHGPFVEQGSITITADNADLMLYTTITTDVDFGSAVRAIADIDGDLLPEIMVAGWHEDAASGGVWMRTYVFSGADGDGLFMVDGDALGFDPWAPVLGDVNGDGAVTQTDLDIVIANNGLENATRADGDLNEDGFVDGLDAMIATIEQGSFPMQMAMASAPNCDGQCGCCSDCVPWFDGTTWQCHCKNACPIGDCGNGECDPDENYETCPQDCHGTGGGGEGECGNGECEQGENANNCPEDCDPSCGNGECEPGENATNCPEDCNANCGNGICDPGENANNCPGDCIAICGNGECEPGEYTANCPQDCGELCIPVTASNLDTNPCVGDIICFAVVQDNLPANCEWEWNMDGSAGWCLVESASLPECLPAALDPNAESFCVKFTAPGEFSVTLSPEGCPCTEEWEMVYKVNGVGFVEMKGLYEDKPSGDPLPYAGGRVFTNRAYDPDNPAQTIWTRNQQYVDITVQVACADLEELPVEARLLWEFEDVDDPSNKPPTHNAAGELLDPNDYDDVDNDLDGVVDVNDGNDNTGTRDAPEWWQQLENYAMTTSGAEGRTALSGIIDGISKARFHVQDDGGDNYRIKVSLQLPDGVTCAECETKSGILTVWKLIDVEYVRMASAQALDLTGAGNDALDATFVELRPTARAVPDLIVAGKLQMGANELDATQKSHYYATAAAGTFSHQGDAGWFFAAAANYFVDNSGAGGAPTLYDGSATVMTDGVTLQLPPGATLSASDIYMTGQKTASLPSAGGYRVMQTDRVFSAADEYADGTVYYDYDPVSQAYQGSATIISHTQGAPGNGAQITYAATGDAPNGLIQTQKRLISAVRLYRLGSASESVKFNPAPFSWDPTDRTLKVYKKGYSTPTQYNTMLFALPEYDFPVGAAPQIRVEGAGAIRTIGISPLGPGGGFNGRTIVFTADGGDTGSLVHEFGHALGFEHICGNWDYRSNSTAGLKWPTNGGHRDTPAQWLAERTPCYGQPTLLRTVQA